MKFKKLKDPIYGYIEIREDIICKVIDSATFQRLRNIRQTSYAPLYPAALHNRFVHSLGVYHLGKIAFSALKKSAEYYKQQEHPILGKLCSERWERYQNLFELACMLHDVGHSPFSHTGEIFYLTSKSCQSHSVEAGQKDIEVTKEYKYSIQKHLYQLTEDPVFTTTKGLNPAPHEIMSCIVALEAFPELFVNSEEKSFFARCITGIQYEEVVNLSPGVYYNMPTAQADEVREKQLKNCFIQLLHSSVIDVDRLDYIIRDASTMGYQSVSIDYERLLNGIVFVMMDEYNFTFGFHKNALSVIENAVYAHDNEKKWVQGHPTILYDSFLLDRCIRNIEENISSRFTDTKSTLFSYDSLTSKGSQFGDMRIRYLSDADLIHLMKNVYSSKYSEEYFSRNTRRHPLWKSEAEFRNFFSTETRKKINHVIDLIMRGEQQGVGAVEVNDEYIEAIAAREEDQSYPYKNDVDKEKKKYAMALLDTCGSFNIKRDIVLMSASFFKSNFSKEDIRKIPILFPNGQENCILKDVSTLLSSDAPQGEKMCYLFYYPPREEAVATPLDVQKFTQALMKAIQD